ncbi:MAG: TIGR04255 family protein [Pirellulaceae bacterium]
MRTEPALKLERSPLILVLAQIRFTPVLKMADYVPDIQDKMRQEGLVRFTPEETQQIVFGPVVKTNQSTRWVFSNRLQNESVILSNDFFVYQVSRYEVFERYVERLLLLFKHIRERAGLNFAAQIGLRYVDLVRSGGSYSVDDFIAPSLRGLSAVDLGVKTANHQFAIQSQTEIGTLFLRSYENTGDQFLPPDLQTQHLAFPAPPANDEDFRILDFDHISKEEVDFEGDGLSDLLWKLHEATKKAFDVATTSDAMKYWKGDNV